MDKKIEITDCKPLTTGFVNVERASFKVACFHDAHDPRTAYASEEFDREIVIQGNAVAVLPYNPSTGKVMLVEQFRAPAFVSDGIESITEACAGMIDEGESPRDALIRETQEELGLDLRNASITNCGTYFANIGTSTHQVTLYLAEYREIMKTGSGGGLDSENENINVIELPDHEFLRMGRAKEFRDMKTMLLCQFYGMMRLRDQVSRIGV